MIKSSYEAIPIKTVMTTIILTLSDVGKSLGIRARIFAH
jgi:hypothetical protein